MNSKRPTLIAIAFFVIWLAILYAGADHPPPWGFFWLLPLVGAGAVAVYLRMPEYAAWSRSRQPFRLFRVGLEGVAAGSTVGVITLLLPFTGEPSISSLRITDVVTWIAVLAALGNANAVMVYGLATISVKARRY
jgi:membrane protease YdiL (CAAX protease family)